MKSRGPLIVSMHVVLIVLANYSAFWLRFDGVIPDKEFTWFIEMLPWLVAIRTVAFIPFKLYEGLWRYTSIWDLRNIIFGVISSTVGFYLLVHGFLGNSGYPRSVFLVDSVLLICFLGGIRLIRRISRDIHPVSRDQRILIYGAGDAGEMLVRDMKRNSFHEYEPIGFVDDDPKKVGQRIHGVKVLGTRQSLSAIIEKDQPHAVVVAIPRAEATTVRSIVKILEPFKIPIKTLPNLRDILGGKVELSQIRNLSIEDLLERAPVGLDATPLRSLISGKRVLVTGAGGSIGAELCRQIISFHPMSLILYERYENGLYAINHELCSVPGGAPVQAVIGDVTDEHRLSKVMQEYRPQLIFHAAAHKHVPLMESNPCEAVKNNVIGTRLMLEAAQRFDAEAFILISTDKAVNPSSVMGACKRVAELLVQQAHREALGKKVYAGVRFGNVLGSNGSVVHLFRDQIKVGGPVTVTHPEIRRYFMLIPEAVHLVLHSASLARGGEIFILEMGEQIKVVDMARNLIRLSGFVPDQEIPISFVGLRPGEKLFEELVEQGESVEPSGLNGILALRSGPGHDLFWLKREVAELERLALEGNTTRTVEKLKAIVPTYNNVSSEECSSISANHISVPL
jgi:FlaA1/EpsC-like NDP-sugar epimerase